MDQDDSIQTQENLRKSREHFADSINLLIFTFLLILVVLTIWLFKFKKLQYVHETGLAIFYGLYTFFLLGYNNEFVLVI